MSDSSAENLLNQPTGPVEHAPDYDSYTPMRPEEPDREKTFSSDSDGIEAAAKEVTERRGQEPAPVERESINLTGPHAGERRPANETVTAAEAAEDLTRVRDAEWHEAHSATNQAVAEIVDQTRGVDPTTQQLLEQQFGVQPETTPDVSGIDPDIAQAINSSPKLRAALEQEAEAITRLQTEALAMRDQYAAATQQSRDFAIHSMLAAIPELHGLPFDQLPGALQVLKVRSPERYADAVSHLSRVDQLGKAAQQQQQQQAAAQQQAVQQWAAQQDQIFEEGIKGESPET